MRIASPVRVARVATLHSAHPSTHLVPAESTATRAQETDAGDSGVKMHAWAPPTDVFIKVGDGIYGRFKHADLLSMDRTDLLKALKSDELFGTKLKAVPLDECAVAVLKGTLVDGKKKPDVSDEVDAAELELGDTVSDVARAHGTGERLFIHVRLPGAATASAAGACVSSVRGARVPVASDLFMHLMRVLPPHALLQRFLCCNSHPQ